MRLTVAVLLGLLCLTAVTDVVVRCQSPSPSSEGGDGEGEGASPSPPVAGGDGEGEGATPAASGDGEGEGDGGEGTDVGANPPGSLVGCNSPYTYLEANSRGDLFTFHALVEGDPSVKAAMKYRNNTGTLLIPSDNAFTKFTTKTGVNVLTPGAITTSLLQALLEYHFLFEVIDPATLAASSGSTSYDTALVLDASGVNSRSGVPVWELFVQDPSLTYQSVNVTAAALGAGQGGQNAPEGTYKVVSPASTANINWNTNTQPVRTCAGVVYIIDQVLLPTDNVQSLNAGGTATAPIAEAGESEGASLGDADAPLPAGVSTAGRKLK